MKWFQFAKENLLSRQKWKKYNGEISTVLIPKKGGYPDFVVDKMT